MNSPSKSAVDAWARRELKVGPDAPPLEVRQSALRLVGRMQFGPSFDDLVAIGVAFGRPRDSIEVFQKEAIYSREEEAFRRETEEFAGRFFDFPKPERVQRWRELHQKSEVFPWWRPRLAELERWLAIERPAEFVNPLAEMMFATFALPPVERAARRREAFNALSDDELADVAALVAEVRRRHSEAAETAAIEEMLPKPPKSTWQDDRAGGSYSQPTPAQSAQTRRWPAFAVVLVLLAAVRILTSDSITPRRTAPAWEQGGQFRPPQVDNRQDDGFEKARRKFQFERDPPNPNGPGLVAPDLPRPFRGLPEFKPN